MTLLASRPPMCFNSCHIPSQISQSPCHQFRFACRNVFNDCGYHFSSCSSEDKAIELAEEEEVVDVEEEEADDERTMRMARN